MNGRLFILSLMFACIVTCLEQSNAAINIERSKAMTKFVTPNEDGKNDTFVFQCHNPMDLFVSGKIYSLKGRLIAKMQDADVSGSDEFSELSWNPNSGSEKAKGGVYIYQIVIGLKVYRGTVIVVR
ncbi:MAG: gliding motility-associated C-terminal domain-containing protein [Elusimicrobia bacterium]|nr:gliding motility-associated C-terminal domain-containing protein [Elusimicrobiota bacterium]